jgi:outer membrane biosynthesis protein TonB
LNQDLLKDKSGAGESRAPSVKTRGPADQLKQVQGAGVRPSPASSPQQAQGQKEAAAENRQNQASGRENQTSEKMAVPQKVENALKGEAPPKGEDTDIFKNRPKVVSQNQEAMIAKAPSPARNAVAGSPGGNKISTQEMSRFSSHGAQLYGVTSFEATGSGMGVYMKNLKEKIWLNWFPYLVSRYPQDFKTADAVLDITLNEKGDVKIVKLVESEGSPLFAAFCMESVQRASNFGAVPKEILALVGKDELELKFGFHYK